MAGSTVMTIGNCSLTGFGLTAMAAYALMLLTGRLLCGKRARRALSHFAWLALPLGLIGSRTLFVLVNFSDSFAHAPWQALAMWTGGHSLYGAFFGALLAAHIAARREQCRLGSLLDALTPGAALFVLLIRLAEHRIGEGVGKEIDTAFLMNTPFAMRDVYGYARHAVYRLEALVAGLLCAQAFYALHRRRKGEQGEVARGFLILFTASQTVLESMRDDGYLRINYLRISQILSFLLLLGLLAHYGRRLYRARGADLRFILWHALAFAGAGLAIRQEFAVDSAGNLELNYLWMALGVGLTAACALRSRALARREKRAEQVGHAKKRAPLAPPRAAA